MNPTTNRHQDMTHSPTGTRRRRLGGISLIASLVLALTALVSVSPASAETCPAVTWGSLQKSAAAATTAHTTGVRVGQQPCHDRLVVDLDGTAAGYRVEYVTTLTADGSGAEVPVDGGAIIRIIAFAPAHDDDGAATVDPAHISATDVSGYRTFRDVEWAGSFEGQTTIGLGVRARLPFRVFSLSGPGDGSRLVIDVAHSWNSITTDDGSSADLPGDAFDGHARAGDRLAVMGVASDDVLNIRANPGVGHPIVATAAPTEAHLVATGRARSLARSIWYEVTIDGTTGWANSRYLGFVGSTDDVTSSFLNGRPYPAAGTMTELGELVAANFASDDPPSSVVVSVAPSVGDLAEITLDVIGLGGDSVAGLRLHVFATPDAGGDGFVLRTIEATTFCARGSDGETCV